MNPFERLAALRAMSEGLNAAIAKTTAEVAEARQTLRIRGVQDTDWGTISQRSNPAKIKYNGAALLAWAKATIPHEVEKEHVVTVPESVRSTLYATLEKRLEIVGDEVIDTATGEVVDFASVDPGKPDSVVFTMTSEKKREAVALVGSRVESVADALTHELAS